MYFKIGYRRIVLILPFLGIVLKFPRIRLLKSFICSFKALKKGRFLKRWSMPIDSPWEGLPKSYLFRGIADCWRERRFYKQTKHRFLQPTYVSFFGLLNIQRFGRLCSLGKDEHACQLIQITDSKVFCDIHHFSNPANFCVENGELRILDYTSERVQQLVQECGEKIISQYDPAPSPNTESETVQVE